MQRHTFFKPAASPSASLQLGGGFCHPLGLHSGNSKGCCWKSTFWDHFPARKPSNYPWVPHWWLSDSGIEALQSGWCLQNHWSNNGHEINQKLPNNCVESKQCIQIQRSYTCAATFCTYTCTCNISGIYFYTYIYICTYLKIQRIYTVYNTYTYV